MPQLRQSFCEHIRHRQRLTGPLRRTPIGLCGALASAAVVLALAAQPGLADPPPEHPESDFRPPAGLAFDAELSAAITAAARARAGDDIEVGAWAYADLSLGCFLVYQAVSLAHGSDAIEDLHAALSELAPPTVTEARRDSATTTLTFVRGDMQGVSRTFTSSDRDQSISAHSATCFYSRRAPEPSQALCDQALNQLVPTS